MPGYRARCSLRGAPSKEPVFRERETQPIADDEVIEHPHVHQCQRLLEAPGDELVRLARLENSRWMVMRENERRGIVRQSLAQHLPGMHPGTVDRAAEQLLEGDEPVAVVEEQAAYLYCTDRERQPRT